MTPIIVLNLERAPERKEIMIKQFTNLRMDQNLHYYFMPAYDGRYMSNLTLNANIGIGYGLGRQFQKGELGIIMTHLAALKFAQMMDWDNVIIIEDDVILCEDWHERLDKLFWLLPKDWEHVYLSAHSDYVKFENLFDVNGNVPGIIKSPQAVGAFSYMVNKSAYSKVIKYTTSFMTTFDDMIMYMILQGKLNSHLYFPFMTFHNANNSFVWSETPGHLAHDNTKMHSSYKYFKNKL
jgi:GR25 family glycosyltransferase involved in LPS biosynthesis